MFERCLGPVDIALCNTSFDIPKELFPGRKVYLPGEIVPEEIYAGKVATIWATKTGRMICPRLKVFSGLHVLEGLFFLFPGVDFFRE